MKLYQIALLKTLVYFFLISGIPIKKSIAQSVDLKLSSAVVSTKMEVNEIGKVTFTLTNENSTTAATNVKVVLINAYKAPFAIFQSAVSSAGSFDITSNIWNIPNLPAGQSANLAVQYKIINGGAWYLEGEVYSVDQSDTDSTPFNGIDSEDDYTRSCISIPINVSNTDFGAIQIFLTDSSLNNPNWFKNGTPITNSTENVLQILETGTYSYSKAGFACPEQGCCPIIVQVGTVPPCCTPMEYFMERTIIKTYQTSQVLTPPSDPLSDGLIAHYPFDNDAKDYSGNHLDGTIKGASLTNDRKNQPNSAYLFDERNDIILVPHNEKLNIKENLTLSVWVNLLSGNKNGSRIIDKSVPATGIGYLLDLYNTKSSIAKPLNTPRFIGTEGFTNIASQEIPIGSWTHLAVTYAKGKVKTYVNGLLINETQEVKTQLDTNSQDLQIGNRVNTNSENFIGALDEVRIYNRALSSNEIMKLYEK